MESNRFNLIAKWFLHHNVAVEGFSAFLGILSFTTFQEPREPESRGLGVPREPILVVHINNSKTLGIALSPLKIVKKRPGKVSLNVRSIPVNAPTI